jgi:hypothetical protein
VTQPACSRRDDVELEGAAQLRDGNGGSRAERLDGGRVVDQDVHAACRKRRRGRAAALLFVAEVSGNDPDLPGGDAPVEQAVLGLRQLVHGAGDQDQPDARVRQPESDSTAIPRPAPVISAVLAAKPVTTTVSSPQEKPQGPRHR